VTPAAHIPRPSVPPRILLGALIALLLGIGLRAWDYPPFESAGPDEIFYANYYVKNVARNGPQVFPRIFADYIGYMRDPGTQLVLPPGRLVLTTHAVLLHTLGIPAYLDAVRTASFQASAAFLVLSAIFAFRWCRPVVALGTVWLVAVAPLHIHLAHRALVDATFAAVALATLWLLWETTRPGASRRWAWGLGVAAWLLVLTKENAAFIFLALAACLAFLQLRGGWRETRFWHAWHAFFLGGLAAVATLVLAAGGPTPLLEAYQLNVQKSYRLEYGVRFGDGAPHRYLIDFLLLSPAITLLALGGLLILPGRRRPLFALLALFTLAAWAAMAWVRQGINLRYAMVLDFPLRLVAAALVWYLVRRNLPRATQPYAAGAAIGVLVVHDLYAYYRVFVEFGAYDPVTQALAEVWNILKIPRP